MKGAFYLHSSFTVSNELFIKVKELATKYNAFVAIHIEEDFIDVYHNIKRYGVRLIERMYRLRFLGNNVHLVHVVNTTLDELRLVKTTSTHIVHNPMSNMLNTVGVALVSEMLEMGINVGLSNDGVQLSYKFI